MRWSGREQDIVAKVKEEEKIQVELWLFTLKMADAVRSLSNAAPSYAGQCILVFHVHRVQINLGYARNPQHWPQSSATPPPKSVANTRSSRSRPTRSSNLASSTPFTPSTHRQQPQAQPQYTQLPQPYRSTPQACSSSYASRLRTGSTLLVQPILSQPAVARTTTSRRGGVINYADPGSGDDMPDPALDSDDSEFMAGSSTRAALRSTRARTGQNSAAVVAPATPPPKTEKAELDQTYLGQIPPSRFIKSRPITTTAHEYP